MRVVRIDDYPSGNPGYNLQESRAVVSKVVSIFEEYKVPYLLGVTPMLMDGDDIAFLNSIIKTGRIAMHGFCHAFNFKPWDRIVETWPEGGEFRGMTEEDILPIWRWCDGLLSRVQGYDRTEFIPPFNCITQAGINALAFSGVKRIHTCSKEWDAYNYSALDWKGMEPVVSSYQTLYHDADKVLAYMQAHPEDKGQVTLHWMFDKNRPEWTADYRDLCHWIANEKN